MTEENQITVESLVNAPVKKVWECFTEPQHITKWCQATDDWQAPYAENDVRTGGKFKTRMEAKDGSEGFDFEGTYTNVEDYSKIEYSMSDGRKVKISFMPEDNGTKVSETFEMETMNPREMQQAGWQMILDNFKKYTEHI